MRNRKHYSRRGLGAAAAMAVAAAVVGTAAPAAAQWKGGATAERPTQVDGGPTHVAPTENLTKVANRFVYKQQSVTSQLEIAPGPAPTAPIMITVSFGGSTKPTQQYSAWAGNRFIHHFPALDGMPRHWEITVDLVEQQRSGNISYRRTIPVDIVPQYDIHLSPLTFTLLSDCDWTGNSEPHITWFSPLGEKREVELSMKGGQTRQVTSGFEWFFEKKTAYDGLLEPSVTWYEADFSGAHLGPSPGDTKLFPGGTHTRSWDSADPDCTGHLEYTVTFYLWTYPYL